MVKLKKRKKRTRIRGGVTCGYGFRQTHKGSGSRGGVGWAGSGKRAKHKKQVAVMYAKEHGYKSYFGKRGITSAKTVRKKNEVLNLNDLQKNFSEKEIHLEEYKILGEGSGFKAVIYAKSASKNAIEKMEQAGGKIILKKNKSDKKHEFTEEKDKSKE